MPTYLLPAVCPRCKNVYSSGFAFGSLEGVTATDNMSQCPRCNAMGIVADVKPSPEGRATLRMPFAVPAVAILTVLLSDAGIDMQQMQALLQEVVDAGGDAAEETIQNLRDKFLDALPGPIRSHIESLLPREINATSLVFLLIYVIMTFMMQCGTLDQAQREAVENPTQAAPTIEQTVIDHGDTIINNSYEIIVSDEGMIKHLYFPDPEDGQE